MKSPLASLRRNPLALVAAAVLLGTAGAAVLADFIASDLPIYLRLSGRIYLFPNLVPRDQRSAELRVLDTASLRATLRPGDIMLSTPLGRGPEDVDLKRRLQPPAAGAPLGTDALGRDVLARIVHGARISLTVGLLAVSLYTLIGLFLGLCAGWFGGLADSAISRAIEAMMVFPTMLLVLAILGIVARPTIFHIMLVMGLTGWPAVARLARGEALRIRSLDYVAAGRALGGSNARLIVRHVLPNALGPVLVAATLGVATAILMESALSFLGFGTPPPTASWGEMLTEAYEHSIAAGAWWLAVFPGLALFLTVGAWNLLAEALRDAMDPRVDRE